MNKPPYYIVDALGSVAALVKDALNLDNLNYQYGYREELNIKLKQLTEATEAGLNLLKFPLIWVMQPFTVKKGDGNYYGVTNDLEVWIMTGSDVNDFAEQRMTKNFKPLLIPIAESFIEQLDNASDYGISTAYGQREYSQIDRYYWGEEQKSVFNDIVDCVQLSGIPINILHNSNCQ